MRLRAEDRLLLDLLCLAAPMAAELDRAFRLKPGWGQSIDSLRMKGLVAWDSLAPSPSALADFADRQGDTNDTVSAAGEVAAILGRLRDSDVPAPGPTPAPAPASRRSAVAWSASEERALEIAFRRGLSLSDVTPALDRNYYAVAKHAELSGYRFGHRPRLAAPIDLAGILALDDPNEPAPAFRRRERFARVRQPEPWPEERQKKFLETIERTGNIGAALEAIGLKATSRKSAYRLKHRDPLFSAAWDAALKASPYKPGRPPKPKVAPPPRAKRARAAPRPTGWADRGRQDEFVAALRRTGLVRQALLEMGFAGATDSQVRRARAEDRDFDRRCDEALEARRADRQAVKAIAAFAAAALAPPPRPRPTRARRPRPRLSKHVAQVPPTAPLPPPTPTQQRQKPGGILCAAGAAFASSYQTDSPLPRRHKSDAEIAEDSRRYQEERRRFDQMERGGRLSLDDAKLTLQRRGLSVCRASVVGGSPDRWAVGTDKNVTDEQLVERAERARERAGA